ncbi:amidohydrolase [Roseinatronobacter alkalisoli]|uniref:Amidohydrolase n=1 Tax=Roseinatronobacter alkalisoli TaxID=3028235 RepID=A0ABT5TEY7_9RHOB|nr:amidohydrolase [Roseinatronobacter sp. HJB301]MDD7972931.1 amidohydrolase [Roseinatronobacter sp. HJB301]
MNADLIITGASALTMDPQNPKAAAVAIADGRIIEVGTDNAVMAHAGPDTRIVKANGATLLPGFIEAHMHLFGGGASLKHLLLTGTKGFDAICEKVQAHAKAHPDAKVIYVQGVDYDMLDGQSFDRHILDRMIADRPLAFVAFDFHTMWANTRLLEDVGLLKGKQLGPGNEIVMGDDGLATGELREVEAFGPVDIYAGEQRSGLGLATGGEPDPAPTEQERARDKADIMAGLKWCARHGITSIHNMDGNLYTLDLLKEIEADGNLICRVKVPFHFKNFMGLEMLNKASMMHETYQGDWVNSGMVKCFCDGVMEGFTGYLVEDYADRPGYHGEPLFTEEQMTAMMVEADRRGLQIAVHSCGDGAVRQVLNGYEAAQKANGARDARHRVEHIELIQESDIARFKELGAIASMQPPHPPGAMDFPVEPAKTRIGPDRWHLAYAWRRMIDAGAHVVFSSDWPVARIDVLAGIHAALTWEPWEPHLPRQTVTLHEALAGYTIEGAYAEHAEDRKGLIKKGYLADFVLLSGDIEATPVTDIPGLTPVMTICGGKVTHETGN